MKILEGPLTAQGLKVGLVAARFNSFIVERMVEGALDALTRLGASRDDVTLVRCPGAFELPQVARWMIDRGDIDAVVCLACVIRGATPHFDYVASEVAKGIGVLALESKIPVTFGVLTTDTIEQAVERAGTKSGNKGFDAAMAAVEMAGVRRVLGSPVG